MRKVLRVTAAAAAGLTLLSCNRPPEPQRVVYAPQPPAHYGNSTYAQSAAPQPPNLVWRPSPRWATVKSKARSEPKTAAKPAAVKADSEAKFREAQAKAAEVGVENLTGEDIEGLDMAQLKELRGY